MMTVPIIRWFRKSSEPSGYLQINGYGLYEPMPNKEIERPTGTGDWLLMHFHHGAIISDANNHYHTYSYPVIVLWPPKARQNYASLDTENLHSWIHFNGSYIDELQRKTKIPLASVHPIQGASLLLLLEFLHKEYEQQVETSILQAFFNLLFHKLVNITSPVVTQRKVIPAPILKTHNYLIHNFTENLTLAELAKIANYSPSHFSALFRKYYAIPPMQYITNLRIEKAKYLLTDINYNVSEIALLLGYSDVYQFSKIFKNYTNKSPLQFRSSFL